MALKYLPKATDQPNARYNSDTVPWQRVVNSKGVISPRRVLFRHLSWVAHVQLTPRRQQRNGRRSKSRTRAALGGSGGWPWGSRRADSRLRDVWLVSTLFAERRGGGGVTRRGWVDAAAASYPPIDGNASSLPLKTIDTTDGHVSETM